MSTLTIRLPDDEHERLKALADTRKIGCDLFKRSLISEANVKISLVVPR